MDKLTPLAAALLTACIAVDKVPESKDMSAVAAKEMIDLLAHAPYPADCSRLQTRIGEQAMRYVDGETYDEYSKNISDNSANLADGRTRVQLITKDVGDGISKLMLIFTPIDPEDTDGMFIGELGTKCKKEDVPQATLQD
jgi:hypothetical protein